MRNYDKYDEPEHPETEITLGTRSILGIFFGLVLICGVFFGFGYSVGRGNSKAAPAVQSAAMPASDSSAAVKTVVEQPASASADSSASDPYDYSTTNSAKPSGAIPQAAIPQAAVPATPSLTAAAPTPAPATATLAAPAPTQIAYHPAPAPNAASATYSMPAAVKPAAAIMVQIAAVSRQQDADVLISALKRRGFSATVHTEPADHFLHVQMGPFASRAQAAATRAQLLSDGYNAILK